MAGWVARIEHSKTIWVLEQSGEWACGICCAGMALSWTGHGFPSETMLAGTSRKTSVKGHRYEFAIQDRPDMKATPLVGLLPKIEHVDVLRDPGTTSVGVTSLLNGYPDIEATLTFDPSATACKFACRATADDGTSPVIMALVDPPHFVICHSHVKVGDSWVYLIANPGDGTVFLGDITETGGKPYLDGSHYGSVIDRMIEVSVS